MKDGRREGWVEVAIVVGGHTVSDDSPLVRATTLGELPALRRRLAEAAGAKLKGVDLVDGDIVIDFHKDEPGREGGIESYALDPVSFAPAAALEVLPAVLGLPRGHLLEYIGRHMPDAPVLEASGVAGN